MLNGKRVEDPVLLDLYLCYYDNNKKDYCIYQDTKTKNTSNSEYGTNQKGCIQLWNSAAYKEYHAVGMMKTNITKNYGKIKLKKNQIVYVYHVGEELDYGGPYKYSLKISKKK